MREDQIEVLERIVRRYFPNGALICAVQPNEALHTLTIAPDENKEYEELLDHLGALCIEECQRLNDLYDEQHGNGAAGV